MRSFQMFTFSAGRKFVSLSRATTLWAPRFSSARVNTPGPADRNKTHINIHTNTDSIQLLAEDHTPGLHSNITAFPSSMSPARWSVTIRAREGSTMNRLRCLQASAFCVFSSTSPKSKGSYRQRGRNWPFRGTATAERFLWTPPEDGEIRSGLPTWGGVFLEPEGNGSREEVLAEVEKVLCLVKDRAQGDADVDLDVPHRVLKARTKNLHPPHAAMMTNKPEIIEYAINYNSKSRPNQLVVYCKIVALYIQTHTQFELHSAQCIKHFKVYYAGWKRNPMRF